MLKQKIDRKIGQNLTFLEIFFTDVIKIITCIMHNS